MPELYAHGPFFAGGGRSYVERECGGDTWFHCRGPRAAESDGVVSEHRTLAGATLALIRGRLQPRPHVVSNRLIALLWMADSSKTKDQRRGARRAFREGTCPACFDEVDVCGECGRGCWRDDG